MLSLHSSLRVCSQAVTTATVFVLLASPQALAEGDPVRGKVMGDTCEGCHSIDSYTNVYPTYRVPRLGGQSTEYLIAALTLYREGNREHPTMTAQAASFSDQDIQDIAAWLSSITPPLAAGDAAATLPAGAPEAAQVCAACHGVTGISTIAINPHLAGQHLDYLEQALSQYRDGKRTGPNAIAMQAQIAALSDDDLEAVVKYYSQQDGLAVLPTDD